MNDQIRAAHKVAQKIAKGGMNDKQRRRAVRQWCEHIRAAIKGNK